MYYRGKWRTSSRSGQANNCVEVRNDLHAIRDSKNPNGSMLLITKFTQLVQFVQAGHA